MTIQGVAAPRHARNAPDTTEDQVVVSPQGSTFTISGAISAAAEALMREGPRRATHEIAGLELHMKPRRRDMECSISSLTRNRSTGVLGGAVPVVRGSSPSVPTRRRREREARPRKRRQTAAHGEGWHGGRPPPGKRREGGGAGRGGLRCKRRCTIPAPYRHNGAGVFGSFTPATGSPYLPMQKRLELSSSQLWKTAKASRQI